MDKLVVIVFDNESKAYEGVKGLKELQEEGSIDVYSQAVVVRDADGNLETKQQGDMGPVGTAVGMIVGAMAGIIGGPAGVAIGAGIGTYGGMLYDLAHMGINQDFLTEVEESLQPGKAAIVAEIEEEWTLPLDNKMEALGGVVLRRTRQEFVDDQIKQENAALRAELAELQAEYNQANAEGKAKLQVKIDATKTKLKMAQDTTQAKIEASQLETEAKIKYLNDQAAKGADEQKAKREERIAELKAEQKRRSDQLKEDWEKTKEALSK